MVVHAQDYKGAYPGIKDASERTISAFVPNTEIKTYGGGGDGAGGHVGARFAIMLENDLFSPEYCVSPAETFENFETWNSTTTNYNDWWIPPFFHSYALPNLKLGSPPVDVGASGARVVGRFSEWSETLNAESPVISDRLVENSAGATNWGTPDLHKSLWSKNLDAGGGDYGGSVTFNDGHTLYSNTSTLDRTRIGEYQRNDDNLFFGWEYGGYPENAGNAFMVVKGNEQPNLY